MHNKIALKKLGILVVVLIFIFAGLWLVYSNLYKTKISVNQHASSQSLNYVAPNCPTCPGGLVNYAKIKLFYDLSKYNPAKHIAMLKTTKLYYSPFVYPIAEIYSDKLEIASTKALYNYYYNGNYAFIGLPKPNIFDNKAQQLKLAGAYTSAKFQGQLQITMSNTYYFKIITKGLARLYIDNHLVANAWTVSTKTQFKTGKIYLSKGIHTIYLEYINPVSDGYIRIDWSWPQASYRTLGIYKTTTTSSINQASVLNMLLSALKNQNIIQPSQIANISFKQVKLKNLCSQTPGIDLKALQQFNAIFKTHVDRDTCNKITVCAYMANILTTSAKSKNIIYICPPSSRLISINQKDLLGLSSKIAWQGQNTTIKLNNLKLTNTTNTYKQPSQKQETEPTPEITYSTQFVGSDAPQILQDNNSIINNNIITKFVDWFINLITGQK